MNRFFSYDWLKEYVKLDAAPDKVAERVSLSGPAVERILPAAELLDNVVVGYVEAVEPHPDADRLRVAKTRIGKRKLATIVCGGSNLREGQWVAVAGPGARVRWHGEGDPVTLEPTKIRGVESQGMIAAANEIGLEDAFPHEEREILDLGTAFSREDLDAGQPLAELLGLDDDVLFDVEVTTNRVDAMGTVGMAREVSAIMDRPFLWKPSKIKGDPSKSLPGRQAGPLGKGGAVSVTVHDPELCPRYMAVRMDNVSVGPSPWWLRRRLMSAGMNSINNVVDITNLVLLELSQPLHAFDAAKISGGLHVRRARRGEKIRALDGVPYDLDDTMLVIADEKEAIAIAGVKGGELSGIGNETTSVILEAATFDPVSIRKTSRKLDLITDAQQRFEKGLSTESAEAGLSRAVELVKSICGGRVASKVTDVRATPYVPRVFSISDQEVNSLIGVDLDKKRHMIGILRSLGFRSVRSNRPDSITVEVPWWRDHDIESGRDLVEEIARVYGYGNIPPVVPVGVAPRPAAADLVLEDRVRTLLKGAGAMETYSYSFVSEQLMKKAGYDASRMLHVQNFLSAEHTLMRTSLLPSLLEIAMENREHAPELRLFEVANVYFPPSGAGKAKKGAVWTDLPDEDLELGCVFTGMDEPWRHAKGVAEFLLDELGVRDVEWRRVQDGVFWHPGRTVQAFAGGALIATLGEIHPNIARSFKLRSAACIDMPLAALLPHIRPTKTMTPVPTYPPVLRDLAIQVHERVEYDDVAKTIRQADGLVADVEWFDTYSGKGLPDATKSVAVHLTFSSPERTLDSDEVDAVMEKIALALQEKFKASVR